MEQWNSLFLNISNAVICVGCNDVNPKIFALKYIYRVFIAVQHTKVGKMKCVDAPEE